MQCIYKMIFLLVLIRIKKLSFFVKTKKIWNKNNCFLLLLIYFFVKHIKNNCRSPKINTKMKSNSFAYEYIFKLWLRIISPKYIQELIWIRVDTDRNMMICAESAVVWWSNNSRGQEIVVSKRVRNSGQIELNTVSIMTEESNQIISIDTIMMYYEIIYKFLNNDRNCQLNLYSKL